MPMFQRFGFAIKWLFAILPAVACLSSCHTFSLSSDNRTISSPVMRQQADDFLQAMPQGLQQRQTEAVVAAIAGDNTALEAVRHARNTPPTPHTEVTSRMLTPTLRLYEPASSSQEPMPVLVYLHGGGWTFGSINSCGRFCNAMAATGQMKVVAVDYRLAPEHPYPEGLDDCVAAVGYVTAHAAQLGIDTAHIVVGGDSSGGNLALATALTDRMRGCVESLVLFYPVTKAFADGSESWRLYGRGYGLDADIMEAFNRAYTLRTDPRQPLISIGLAPDESLEKLPRTLIVSAGRDILCDQGRELAERLGGKATRIVFSDAVHLFITVPGQDEAFAQAVRCAADFVCHKR